MAFLYIHICETYVNYSHKGTLLCNNRVWVMAECNRNNSQSILIFKKASYNLNCNPTQGERCGKNKMSVNWRVTKIEKSTGTLKEFKSKYWKCFVSVRWIIKGSAIVFVNYVYVLNKQPLSFSILFFFFKNILNTVSREKDLCWGILLIFSRTVSKDLFCLGPFHSFV